MQIQRTVFFISDGTGITAGALGQLLAHFPQTHFAQVRLPFTDSISKIEDAQQRILIAKAGDGMRPVVIMSLLSILNFGNRISKWEPNLRKMRLRKMR